MTKRDLLITQLRMALNEMESPKDDPATFTILDTDYEFEQESLGKEYIELPLTSDPRMITVRDRFMLLTGNKQTAQFDTGFEIVADDGRALFRIDIEDNVMRVESGDVCKHGGRILDENFSITPKAANVFMVTKAVRKL